ncbi:MAG: hypothetical protein AAF682_04140 [Planctomycetota bacterium]
MSTDQPDFVVLARGGLNNLKEMQRTLQSGGIATDIVSPPDAKPNS